MQSILLCIQTGKTIADADRMEFQTDEFYLKSTDEMYAPLRDGAGSLRKHQQNCGTVQF